MTANKECKHSKLGNRIVEHNLIEYDVEGVVAIAMAIHSSISSMH